MAIFLTSAIVMHVESSMQSVVLTVLWRYVRIGDLLLRLRDHGSFLYVPGEIGVEYSMRITARDNYSSTLIIAAVPL